MLTKYLLLVWSAAVLLAAPAEAPKDAVVATVNSVEITQKDLNREVNILFPKAYFHGNLTPEKRKNVEKEAISNLVDKELLYQEAARQKFNVEETAVMELRENVIAYYGGMEKFEAVLNRVELTKDDFFKELKREMIIEKLLRKEVRVEFSDADIKKYYDENRGKFKEPERLKVRLIMVKINPTDSNGTRKAESRIDEAYEKIESGRPFADVAAKYSQDMTRIKGGDLGYIHKGMLDSRIENIVHQLKPGEYSKIIKTEIGFSIVKLEEKKPSRQLSYETIKEQLKTERTKNVQKRNMEALLERLKSSADIKILI